LFNFALVSAGKIHPATVPLEQGIPAEHDPLFFQQKHYGTRRVSGGTKDLKGADTIPVLKFLQALSWPRQTGVAVNAKAVAV
jgi:hypothetical protein